MDHIVKSNTEDILKAFIIVVVIITVVLSPVWGKVPMHLDNEKYVYIIFLNSYIWHFFSL